MSNNEWVIKIEKFELNLQGLNELMTSKKMNSALYRASDGVIDAAKSIAHLDKPKYKTKLFKGHWINIVNVSARNHRTNQDNLDNNTLLKAVGLAGLPTIPRND